LCISWKNKRPYSIKIHGTTVKFLSEYYSFFKVFVTTQKTFAIKVAQVTTLILLTESIKNIGKGQHIQYY